MKQEWVKDWMTGTVISTTPETTLAEAYELMNDFSVRRLPVLINKELVGIVTQGDIRAAKPADAKDLDMWDLEFRLQQIQVSEVMNPDPMTIPVDATIDEAAWVLMEGKFSGLPVIDDRDEVVGMITESDIFRLVVRKWGQADDHYVASVKPETEGKVYV